MVVEVTGIDNTVLVEGSLGDCNTRAVLTSRPSAVGVNFDVFEPFVRMSCIAFVWASAWVEIEHRAARPTARQHLSFIKYKAVAMDRLWGSFP